MERIFRDMTMGWSHFTNVVADWSARELAREHLGLVTEARSAARAPAQRMSEGTRWHGLEGWSRS